MKTGKLYKNIVDKNLYTSIGKKTNIPPDNADKIFFKSGTMFLLLDLIYSKESNYYAIKFLVDNKILYTFSHKNNSVYPLEFEEVSV